MKHNSAREPAGQIGLWDNRLQTELRQAAAFGVRGRAVAGVIPSGSIAVDAALGIGGLPRGRMVELFGPPGVGKSTLALQVIAAAQGEGQTAALVDVECTFDAGYAARLGVDVDRLVLLRADDGEQALRMVERLVASQGVDLVVVDSVAALAPAEELSGSMMEGPSFAHSEMIANGLRRIARVMAQSPACLLLLNQLRAYHGFGYTETSTGGWGLKLHAAVRADMREVGQRREVRRVAIKVVKNQLAAPGQAELSFVEGEGWSAELELVELGLRHGVLRQMGSAVWFEDEACSVAELRADVDLCVRLNSAVRAVLGLPQRKPVGRAVGAAGRAQRAGGL
jgi:recombination protein RecA